MDAPTCPICEKREWQHVCAGASVSEKPAAKKKPRNRTMTTKLQPVPEQEKPSQAHTEVAVEVLCMKDIEARFYAVENRLDRLENRKRYQRDLMRKRRAKQRD